MFLKLILVLYNLALTGTLLIQGIRGVPTPAGTLLLILLFPAAAYFILLPASKTPLKKIPGLEGLKNFSFTVSLLTTTLILAANLLSSSNREELILAAVILPLPLYFWLEMAGKITRALRKPHPPKAEEEPQMTAQELDQQLVTELKQDKENAKKEAVADPNRRAFLKRAGGLGLGVLAYSLLNPKNAGAAFFGSVPGPGTVSIKDTTDTKIDPAVKGFQSRTTSFGIVEIDDGDPAYYGFINKDGGWYILKEDETTGDFAYRYASLANNPSLTDFDDAWAIRDTTLDYGYFNAAFTS